MNSAINGVFLPMEDGEYVQNEAKHVGNHSPEYIKTVTKQLKDVVSAGGNKQDVVEKIGKIRDDLLHGRLKLN